MAQVTVAQLAETVGASVDRLLSQMKDAGLPHASAEEGVSEEDKQTLLAHLKQSHGERAEGGAPKKITLKRKSVSTLRAGGAGKRTINVEVRKKRTYVKREDLDEAGSDADTDTETPVEVEAGVGDAAASVAAQPASEEMVPVE
ncbi:MAG: translation initiation factor IF-2 associated domain-containing protein, partial [Halieaceae bacterium]